MATKRRALLCALGLGLFGGCLSNPPGPTGPRTPPKSPEPTPREETEEKPPLYVDDFEFEETAEGELRAIVTVGNRTGDDLDGTVVGLVTVGDDEHEESEDVTVAGDGVAEVRFAYPVAYEDFERNGSFTPSVTASAE
ncbi:transcriptional initiation protein Tat [Halegenticoccus tardaugens]|uniref:transcriptional initiation protein Tat n=1 Tax=Halegenticoccus tardaugens TaxID=2071624 RepID=UPI00100B4336|nr:transcriptional initiation protein Tat [Halegenticoccus tardaugens]